MTPFCCAFISYSNLMMTFFMYLYHDETFWIIPEGIWQWDWTEKILVLHSMWLKLIYNSWQVEIVRIFAPLPTTTSGTNLSLESFAARIPTPYDGNLLVNYTDTSICSDSCGMIMYSFSYKDGVTVLPAYQPLKQLSYPSYRTRTGYPAINNGQRSIIPFNAIPMLIFICHSTF